MTLAAGTRVGAYEVVGSLGAGGMGEVYRARDTRLGRDVALKILPESFAHDADRVARFEREAKALAALNHTHIAQIYNLEQSHTGSILVMELVEGEDLAMRIARGPLPVEEALAIARQIANALEAAHEAGIVHRDLKPANVRVRPDGTVKVLDFGLAKAVENVGQPSSPTITSPALTSAGIILGTVAYMAPEQAKGQAVDKRADIWAFGGVLFEMLAGEPAFQGSSVTETLAAVIKDQPRWSALPASTPATVRRLLGRCLAKDRRDRLRDIGDARFDLRADASEIDAAATADPATITARRPWVAIVAASLATAAVAAVIAGAVVWLRPSPAPTLARFVITLPGGQEFTRAPSIAISADGSRIAYVANSQLYVRAIDELEGRPIPGSDVDPLRPFFSPDGQWIGFYSLLNSSLQKVPVSGGPAVTICSFGGTVVYGASWYGDDVVFADSTKGIMRVSANGGVPSVIAEVRPPEVAEGPLMLDDDTALFTITTETGDERWDRGQVVVQSLRSGERKVLIQGGTAILVAADHLVYAVGSTLLAVPFDVKAREVRGGPLPVMENVRRAPAPAIMSGSAGAALSATGTLLHIPAGEPSLGATTLAFAHRDGTIEPLPLPAQQYSHPRVSPKGDQLAVSIINGREADIWIADLVAGGPPRRLTFGGTRNLFPIWTPDGQFVTFQSDREGDRGLYRQRADGSGVAERLTRAQGVDQHAPESWSPDGTTLAFRSGAGVASIFTLTLGDAAPKRFDDSLTANHFNASFSPDGRWLAYTSFEGQRPGSPAHIFVQPFPRTGARYQASAAGHYAQWSPDGRQLVYSDAPSTPRLMVVDVRTTGVVSFGTPSPISAPRIVKPAITARPFDSHPDGKRVLIMQSTVDERPAAPEQINVVLNWIEELKSRVPSS
jgi:serine/threonine-protein kinase